MTGSAGDAAGAAAGGADASAADGADAEASLKRGEAAEAGPAAIPSGPSLAGLHVDSEQQVVLRYDTLKDRAVKGVILSVWLVNAVSLVLLIGAAYLQSTKDDEFFLGNSMLPTVNLAFAAASLAALLAYLAFFVTRALRVNASGKRWTHRRRRLAALACAELGLQSVLTLFMLAPNAYVLAKGCAWFDPFIPWSAFVRWTCWNCIFLIYLVEAHSNNPAQGSWVVRRREERGAPAVIDAPLRWHWRKAVWWAAAQVVYLAATIVVAVDADDRRQLHAGKDAQVAAGGSCHDASYNCSSWAPLLSLMCALLAINVIYFAAFVWFLARSFRHLARLPYDQYRQPNFIVRLHARLRGLSIAFFVLSVVLYTLLSLGTCRSYLLSWLGFLPVQLVTTLTSLINAYVMTPCKPHQDSILRVWLQEFAWSEAELPKRRQQRASSLPPGSEKAVKIDREPMFCVETALKALYWATLVYDHEELPGSSYTIEEGLQMFELQQYQLLWDPPPQGEDVKCLVAWGDGVVVIAFRGTASLANVKSDLQMWRARWPPDVDRRLLGTVPMIHWGFHKAYTTNQFNSRLLAVVRGAVEEAQAAAPQQPGCAVEGAAVAPVRVLVTGHSLGGALATLCAHQLAMELPASAISLSCYTFGAPRTGNHAYARMYSAAVPETWHVANNDDVVFRGGKFLVLYKRGGPRVLINRLGDMVCRPTYAESAIRTIPGATSVRDHLLTSYAAALSAVLGVQFSASKCAERGREGVLRLARQTGAAIALHAAGLPAEALALLQREGWEGLLAARARERVARRRGVLRLLGKGSGAELGGAGSGETAVLEADAEEADADGKEKAAEELAQLEPAAIVAPPRLLNRVSTSLGLQPVLKPTLSVRGAVVADDGLLLAAPAPPAKAWEDP